MTQEQQDFCEEHDLTEEQFFGKEKYNGSLLLNLLTSIPEGFSPKVGSHLLLNSLTSIPEGFNPTIGGSLYLRSLTSIPEGFNPKVGGDLYLDSLTSIPEGFSPIVGGNLYLKDAVSLIYEEMKKSKIEWEAAVLATIHQIPDEDNEMILDQDIYTPEFRKNPKVCSKMLKIRYGI